MRRETDGTEHRVAVEYVRFAMIRAMWGFWTCQWRAAVRDHAQQPGYACRSKKVDSDPRQACLRKQGPSRRAAGSWEQLQYIEFTEFLQNSYRLQYIMLALVTQKRN